MWDVSCAVLPSLFFTLNHRMGIWLDTGMTSCWVGLKANVRISPFRPSADARISEQNVCILKSYSLNTVSFILKTYKSKHLVSNSDIKRKVRLWYATEWEIQFIDFIVQKWLRMKPYRVLTTIIVIVWTYIHRIATSAWSSLIQRVLQAWKYAAWMVHIVLRSPLPIIVILVIVLFWVFLLINWL